MTLETTNDNLTKLFRTAIDARLKAYAPYSKFRVGAALLCEDGSVFTGCNVENVSYGLTICAERTAIVKAISEGKQHFKCIVVTSDLKSEFTTPCGACRQFMCEFGNYDVYAVLPDGKKFQKFTIQELIPKAYNKANLVAAQQQPA